MRSGKFESRSRAGFAIALLFLGAGGLACGGDSTGDATPTDGAVNADGGATDGLPAGSMIPVSVWAPRAIDFSAFLAMDFVPEAAANGLVVTLVEAPVSSAELAAAVRSGLAARTIATDYVLLPELLARTLVRDGLLEEPVEVLFSHPDPDMQPYLLGLALARPAPGMPAAQAPTDTVATLRQAQLVTRARVDAAAGWALKTGAKFIAEKSTVHLLDKYGFTTAARFLGTRALPAVAFAQTAYKVGKLVNASYQVVEAQGGASVSAIETVFAGISSLQGLLPGLYAMRVDIKACEIGPESVNAVLDIINSRAAAYQRVAFDAIEDLAVLGRETPHFQLVDNAMAKVVELSGELRRLANLKGIRAPDPAKIMNARMVFDQIIDMNAAPNKDLQAFAEMLTGQTLANPFLHSDGVKTSMARGPIDILFRGAARVDLSEAVLLKAFAAGGTLPCNKTTDSEHVLCGWQLAPGPVLLVATVFDGKIPQTGTQHYQFGTVFEDVKLSGVYLPSAAYPKDLFQNTNVWYTTNYSPASGWTQKRQMAIGDKIDLLDTSAITILKENALIQIIPEAELGGEPAPFRITAFEHGGDWGAMMPFSGDVAPGVDAPLWPVLAGPYNHAF